MIRFSNECVQQLDTIGLRECAEKTQWSRDLTSELFKDEYEHNEEEDEESEDEGDEGDGGDGEDGHGEGGWRRQTQRGTQGGERARTDGSAEVEHWGRIPANRQKLHIAQYRCT